jgi:hypothetical protein
MLKAKQCIAGIALVLSCAAASAVGMHQICFEAGIDNATSIVTAAYGCAIDGGGTCAITPGPSGFVPHAGGYPPGWGSIAPNIGTFSFYDLTNANGTVAYSGAFTAKIKFYDASGVKLAERSCTVNLGTGTALTLGTWPGAGLLTGFTTDASGLVTTGVWTEQATADQATSAPSANVPGNLVVVGGGAMGVEWPTGVLIVESERAWTFLGGQFVQWDATTSQAGGAAQPHRGTVYAIGMQIEGLVSWRDLPPLLQFVRADSTAQGALSNPSVQVAQPLRTVILGGGGRAWTGTLSVLNQDYFTATNPTYVGQYLTASTPTMSPRVVCTGSGPIQRCTWVSEPSGWRVESKDHVISHPGAVEVELITLPSTLVINGMTFSVKSAFVSATSAQAAHPSVDVSGLRGAYALTGIGASVDWKRYDSSGNEIAQGNLLWKLQPRPDIGGASVASKDHLVSSPATITGYALGIQLIPQYPD